jgi:hypothetical protein
MILGGSGSPWLIGWQGEGYRNNNANEWCEVSGAIKLEGVAAKAKRGGNEEAE